MRERAGPSHGVEFSWSGVTLVFTRLTKEQDSVAAAANWLISALRSSTAWMTWAPDQLSVFVMKTSILRVRAICSASMIACGFCGTGGGGGGGGGGIGFDVARTGIASVGFVGFPSVGKVRSVLLLEEIIDTERNAHIVDAYVQAYWDTF